MATVQLPTQEPRGTSRPQVLGFAGLGVVCLAALLAFVFSIKADFVFYIWIVGLVAQFAAGFWVLYRRLTRDSE